MAELNLQSTVNKVGKTTTQIMHFVGGEVRTFHGVISSEIKDGRFLKLKLLDGRMLIINTKNHLLTEVFNEDDMREGATTSTNNNGRAEADDRGMPKVSHKSLTLR